MFYIGLYREKHGKIFLSETIRLRALIFGHILASTSGLYQVCSNYAPGAKITRDMVSFLQIPICKS